MHPTALVRFVLGRVKDAWIFSCNMDLRHIYCQAVCFRSARIPSERLLKSLRPFACIRVFNCRPCERIFIKFNIRHFCLNLLHTQVFWKSNSMNKTLREDLHAFSVCISKTIRIYTYFDKEACLSVYKIFWTNVVEKCGTCLMSYKCFPKVVFFQNNYSNEKKGIRIVELFISVSLVRPLYKEIQMAKIIKQCDSLIFSSLNP